MQKGSTPVGTGGREQGNANIVAVIVVALLLLVLLFGKKIGLPSDLITLLTKQSGPRIKADAWKTLHVADYGIAVQMPGAPVPKVRSELLDGKDLSIVTYAAGEPGAYEFSVSIMDIRLFLLNREFNPVAGLSGFIQGEISGKVLSDKPINLGPVPGREILAESETEVQRYRVYLKDQFVFSNRVRASREIALSGDAGRFLDSFAFVGPIADGLSLAAGWMEIAPIDGKFAVQMPGDPVEEREVFKTGAGDVVLYKFSLQRGRPDERLSVQYMDYTEKRMKELRTADELLKKAATVDAFNINGAVVSERPLPLGGHPGRELQVENAEVAMRIRLYLVDRRLYKLSVTLPKGRPLSADEERFLNSFRLL